MNKRIELKKNCMVLFIINVCVLISLLLFKIYFSKVGYLPILVNSFLVINIILLIVGIIFNVILFKNPNLYDEKKSLIIMCVVFFTYVLFNTVGMVIINKPFSSSYKKIANELSSYCDKYVCDKFENINEGSTRDFVINKTYLDYNGIQNDIEIHTKYDVNGVFFVEATVYSQNEMFSWDDIKQQVQLYYDNFDVTIDESLIKEAFDKRFNGSVKKDKISYRVSEIYEDGELIKLKTVISLNLKRE